MAQPLLPLSSQDLNCSTPTTIEGKTDDKSVQARNFSIYQEVENFQDFPTDDQDDGSSSIEISTSPFKTNKQPCIAQNATKSPFESPRKQHSPSKQLLETPIPLTEDTLRENEGLTRAIHNLEFERNESAERDADSDTASTIEDPQGYPGIDDTNFTAFSAVPLADVTLFAQREWSPSKSKYNSPAKSASQAHSPDQFSTPLAGSIRSSFDEYSPSPTPRRQKSYHEGDTNFILDFTEQFNAFTKSSCPSPDRSNRSSPKKSQTQPNLASYISSCRTPSPNKRQTLLSETRHHPNLLDFDLPPAPTPRSVPSITARELESLKSSFLSQVSSLRATLSGKEAEVNSLKDAVADAERRVGEALEEIREERGTKESLQAEKLDWERRDKEMHNVLRNVKEVNIQIDRERDRLEQQLEESEQRREEAELMSIEAHSKMSVLEASESAGTNTLGTLDEETSARINRIARDLHGVYKVKHEAKVAAVRASCKATCKSQWESTVRGLETQIKSLSHENEELRLGRDATMSSVLPGNLLSSLANIKNQDTQPTAAETNRIQETEARLAALETELSNTKQENTTLLAQLETERLEMADLITATEEMMQLSTIPTSSTTEPSSTSQSVSSNLVNLKRSISSRGMKAPPGESRIGRMAMAGGSGGSGMRSGIMGSIERMGRGRGGD